MSSKYWNKLKRDYIYKAKTEDEISFVSDKIELPSGRKFDYVFVDCPYEVVYILAKKDNKFLMINQHRYIIDKEILEIPAGSPEKNESLEEGALRELEEETGFKAEKITQIGSFYPSIGMTNQIGHIFLADNLIKTEKNLDETEVIKLKWVDIDDSFRMVKNGEISHIGAAYGILLFKTLFL